jgi:asparagine synthase (glutamine-hydrolysing)
MGGILGSYNLQESQGEMEHTIEQMLSTISHRGTISAQHKCEAGIILGVLSDKGCVGARIAFDKVNNICCVLDGEFFCKDDCSYNSDAVFLIHRYLEKGIDFLEGIDGSFSIAFWDGNRDIILLVRDRLGTKPIFYLAQHDIFVFASEIKAILESSVFKPSVDLISLNNFLSYGYNTNPATMFRGVCQVRPGHVLVWKKGETIEKSYWNFKYFHSKREKSEDYYKEKFIEVFKFAVKRRLQRYPEAGAFLSGGLDTSGVVAMMHKLRGGHFKVFTAGFREEVYNEIDDAKILSDYLELEHYTTIVDFNKNLPELLEKLVWHHDAPFADTSAIPSYFVAKLAKEHVDVVFTGDFPDQLIGGSGHHAFALAREKHDPAWKINFRNRKLNQIVSSLPWSVGSSTTSFDKIKRFLYRETFSLEEQRIILSMPIPPLLKKRLYDSVLLDVNKQHDPLEIARSFYDEARDESLLNKLLYFDILSYAPDDLMVKVDRMSTAHGLVTISPFHDREFVEFIATVPVHLKIKGEIRKYIMKEALRCMLPEQTLNKKKQGFAMPIGEWLVRNLSDYVRDILFDSLTLNRGYFNRKFLIKMVENFLAGKTDYASGSEAAIISLMTLELWHRIFIDQ